MELERNTPVIARKKASQGLSYIVCTSMINAIDVPGTKESREVITT
jgi:hypothetical protein